MSLDFQKRFIDAVLKGKNDPELFKMMKPVARLTSEKALDVYRDDYAARMLEALGSNYETTWLYLGDDEFFSLGREYIKQNPSNLKNLTYYGADFPDFLMKKNCEPAFYIARFEKIFWQLFNAPDSSRKNYSQENILSGNVSFNFSSCFLLENPLNVYELWKHREGSAADLEDVELDRAQNLLLYKLEGRVVIEEISPDLVRFFKFLFASGSIPGAVEKYCQLDLPELTASDWQIVFLMLSYF